MKIAAIQHVLPGRRITNDWILENIRRHSAGRMTADCLSTLEDRVAAYMAASGTETRYTLADGERALDLLHEVSRLALRDASITPAEVDFVIYTGVGRGWIEPATAAVVQRELGLRNASAFDILEACAGWLRAMQVSHSLLRSGTYGCGMVVNCECGLYRSYADWAYESVDEVEHRFAQYTIGEAATATVVTNDISEDDFHFAFRSFGEYLELCMIPLPAACEFMSGSMDERIVPGRFVARSTELLGAGANLLLSMFAGDATLRERSYDICFGHEASARVTGMVTRRLGLHDIIFPTHRRFGNTVSASLPLGMSVALQEGRLRRGSRVLLAVGSAGMTVGLAAFTF